MEGPYEAARGAVQDQGGRREALVRRAQRRHHHGVKGRRQVVRGGVPAMKLILSLLALTAALVLPASAAAHSTVNGANGEVVTQPRT